MNHPSEWARYYDAPNGTYRYRHKGTGVVRDTLMNIGKRFKKQVTRQTLEKAVNKASKQMLKKAAEKAEEKAADKIQAVLRNSNSVATRTPSVKPKGKKTPSVKPKGKKTPSVKPKGKKTPPQKLSTESRQKLKKMLNPGVATQLSGDSRKKLQQILNAGRAARMKVNQLIAEN